MPHDGATWSSLELVALACAVAALANPYGFGLYRHVGQLLVSSGVTSLIIEYQPAPFGKPEAEVLEWVLLAFIGSAGRVGATDRALPVGPRPGVAAPGAHVDSQRPVLCPGGGAGSLATLLDGLPLALRTSWKRR